jgi:hypothetical protein
MEEDNPFRPSSRLITSHILSGLVALFAALAGPFQMITAAIIFTVGTLWINSLYSSLE